MKFLLGLLLLVSLVFSAVDLNTASFDELVGLKGIGEKKAKKILTYREDNCFKSITDLSKVKGISQKKVKKILKKNKDTIEVSPCTY